MVLQRFLAYLLTGKGLNSKFGFNLTVGFNAMVGFNPLFKSSG